jgi:NAD(P)-dependent dehydrogenase (short-subunit alcohol dehydrogenase family)
VAAARDADRVVDALPDSAARAGRLLPLTLDVTDEGQAEAAVAAALDRFGSIDVLVNNAGSGLIGAVEEASAAEVEAVFATNVFGVLNVTRAALPFMRGVGSGHIVNIGSMGGFAQVAGWGIYGATKFALEGLSEALQAELEPLGIRVTIVEPGSFRTEFLSSSSLRMTANELPAYAETAGRVRRAASAADGLQLSDPAKGAAAIYRAVTSTPPPFRLQLGPDAIKMVEGKLQRVRDELETWRALATSTVWDETVSEDGQALG